MTERRVGIAARKRRRSHVGRQLVRHAAALERQPDTLLVERLGVAAHRPAAQSALGAQEGHLRSVHPHERRRSRDVVTRIPVNTLVVGNPNAVAQTHVTAAAESRLVEIAGAAGVGVTVHERRDVGSDAVVALTGLETEEADVERIAVLTEAHVHGVACIVGDDAQLRSDGFFGQLLRSAAVLGGEIGVDDTHRQAELERIGQTAPTLQVTAVDTVGVGRNHACAVARQYFDGGVQVGEHGLEDLLFGIQRHRIDARADLRVGNRTVGVGHAVHAGHLHHLRHGDGVFVLGHLAQLRVIRHLIGIDDAVEHRRPVRLRVVGRELSGVETAVGVGTRRRDRPAARR